MTLTKRNGIINKKLDQFTANRRANKLNSPDSRMVWMKKGEKHTYHVAHIALKTRDTSVRYFDSGYSRHMFGKKSLFKIGEDYRCGTVTLGMVVKHIYFVKVKLKSLVYPYCMMSYLLMV